MDDIATRRPGSGIAALWRRWGRWLLWLAVAFMALAAAQRLADGLSTLVWQTTWTGRPQPRGGADLRIVYDHLQRWVAGEPALDRATLPPASYPILWPLIGWLPLPTVRRVWALTSVMALAWLAILLVRESTAATRAQRCFIALVPFSMYAARGTIWWGQFVVHLLPLVIAGLLLLRRDPHRWPRDLLAVALLLGALVKPSLSAPFMLLLLAWRRIWPAALLALAYAGLTLLAGWRTEGTARAVDRWVAGAAKQAATHATGPGAYGNVHTWLGALGLERWNTEATLLVLAALAGWLFAHRHRDVWNLLAVTAIVARLWTYHRVYDDMLMVVPLLALFRLARRPLASGQPDLAAGILLAVAWASVMAPARLFVRSPWILPFLAGQVAVWLAMLGFLLYRAGAEPQRPSPSSAR